jgi:hypothetical protein
MGMATLQIADTQTGMADQQRRRESSFNLTDAVLSAQAFQLAKAWPDQAAKAYAPCTRTMSPLPVYCPSDQRLGPAFSSVDYQRGAAYGSRVFDNGDGPDPLTPGVYFNEATTPTSRAGTRTRTGGCGCAPRRR